MLFNLKKRVLIIAILTALVFAGLFLKFFSPKKRGKINIILIVVDALRADHLGCYGYQRNTSPNIDKFAKGGVLFTQAFSSGSSTRTAVPSIFTSLYPGTHKVLALGAPLAEEFITLPEILRRNGYLTAAFAGKQLDTFSNFSRRFEIFELCQVKSGKESSGPYLYSPVNYDDNSISAKALNWLRQKPFKPFFLFLHLNATHTPYCLPAPYDAIFWPRTVDEKTKLLACSSCAVNKESREQCFNIKKEKLKEPDKLNYLISQYDGEIRFVDEQIKILLEYLKKSNTAEDTLIILTSDHGEEFLEHGDFFHENTLYDELIHVPLIMRLPGIVPQRKIISNLVRHIDIMPTILDILGIDLKYPIQGRSFIPLIKGKEFPVLDSFSETYFRGKHIKSIRTKKFKFIEAGNLKTDTSSSELYDLERDCREMDNSAASNPKEAGYLKTRLMDYVLSCDKLRKRILGKSFVDIPRVLLDEEKIKSLDYLQ